MTGIPVEPASAAEIRQRIAVMPESPGLYQRLTVTENLEYFARLSGPAAAAGPDSGGAGGGEPRRPGLVAALAGGLLAVDCAACLAVARLFDRERLITGARPSRGIPVPAAPQDIQSPGEVTAHRKGELKCRRL